MFKIFASKLVVVAALATTSGSAFGAIVNGVFTINSATITDLFSTTLDGACTPDAGTFFNCITPAGRSVVITDVNVSTNPGSGSLDVQYNDETGEIEQVNSININLRDMDLTITNGTFGNGFVTIRNGNSFPVGGAEDDITNMIGGTLGTNGTADADISAGGTPSVFQHTLAPQIDGLDFSSFSEVVDTCTPTSAGSAICALIPGLNLDGVRYQITGIVDIAGLGGDAFTLIQQTGTSALLTVDFTTAAVPVPAAGWLIAPAVGAVLARARRRRPSKS